MKFGAISLHAIALIIASIVVGFITVAFLPATAHAIGTQADPQCLPWNAMCPCGAGIVYDPQTKTCPGTGNKANCPIGICVDSTNGYQTPGTCPIAGKCQAGSVTGLNGQSGSPDSSLMQLGQQLGQMLGQMMGGGGQQSPQSGGSSPYSSPTQTTGCQGGYFQTSDPTQLSNPCAQYVPATTGAATTCTDPSASNFGMSGVCTYPTTTGCDTMSQLLGTCPNTTGANASNIDQTTINANPNGSGSGASPSTDYTNAVSNSTPANPQTSYMNLIPSVTGGAGGSAGASLAPSTSFTPIFMSATSGEVMSGSSTVGNIEYSQGGVTIVGGSQNGNTEIVGFFGGSTLGGQQPQGLAAQLCENRPWASNFLSAVIPPSFFDNVCSWAGYQVGMPPPPPAPVQQVVQISTTAQQPVQAATTTASSTPPSVPPRVQIWAVPASVPLDSRTSIFWNTQGVTQCTETSPDGSFSQSSLSGGASTVPITGATTFTISCLDSNGNPVTGYVTVNLSI